MLTNIFKKALDRKQHLHQSNQQIYVTDMKQPGGNGKECAKTRRKGKVSHKKEQSGKRRELFVAEMITSSVPHPLKVPVS